MPDDDKTTISITRRLWRHLNRLKEPGDSFDTVIRREIGLVTDEDIARAVARIEWRQEWMGNGDHQAAVESAARHLRDRGDAEMSELDEHADLDIKTSPKIIRHVRQLPWIEHRGGRKYYWLTGNI